ncbi:unnamed protein product [Dibothriocephalus latus]|uniref:Uncharacterized protein n=1 Tax=Dibothriocephalus latus TaxID=60516 RepID=A0A3P7LQJ2_DIBLA|nr:unnamed protein product [Dibothriocephalus latus]
MKLDPTSSFISATIATIANIIFSYALTVEKIYNGNGLYAVYANQSVVWQYNVNEIFDSGITCTWLSICLALVAGWFWLAAAYVQPPIAFKPTPTVYQRPPFYTTKSQTCTLLKVGATAD